MMRRAVDVIAQPVPGSERLCSIVACVPEEVWQKIFLYEAENVEMIGKYINNGPLYLSTSQNNLGFS